jgi:hypothetical protein
MEHTIINNKKLTDPGIENLRVVNKQ